MRNKRKNKNKQKEGNNAKRKKFNEIENNRETEFMI